MQSQLEMNQFNPGMNHEIKVAIYVRVSTEEQAQHGYSIDAQLQTLRNYCKLYGKTIAAEYVDRGVSGKSIVGRYELQKMLKDAQEKKFDEVIVWKISRLARKTIDLLKIVEDLSKNNITFRSFSENFETETPMGRFALQMMGAVGELERNTIIDNVKLGMAQRSRQGLWNGGICLGYKSEVVGNNARGGKETRLVIVEEEAIIVRKIFTMYGQGKGLRAIANYLNREGYLTKRGNAFSTDSIKEIILNPLYVGKVRFNRFENWSERRRKGKSENIIIVDGIHEPIIEQKLWDKVQAIQQQKAKKPIKNYEGNYVLTGLIKCPVCGATMVGTRTTNKLKDGTKKILRYYSCGAARTKGAGVCGFNSVRADYVEEYVLNRIKEVVNHPRVLKELVDKANQHKKKRVKPLQKEVEAIDKSLESIQASRRKYLDLYESELIDQEMFSGRIKELNNEMEKLILRRSEVQGALEGNDTEKLDFHYVQEVLINLESIIQKMTNEEKKVFYQLIIEEVVIKHKKVQEIKLKIDEQLQEDIMKQSLSDGKSDRDIFMPLNRNLIKLRINLESV